VLLGVESNVWVKDESGATLTLGSVTGTITVYPSATAGFFLKGGFGASSSTLRRSSTRST
jgi:hypothetical protein